MVPGVHVIEYQYGKWKKQVVWAKENNEGEMKNEK
jgi:hypothetical protein